MCTLFCQTRWSLARLLQKVQLPQPWEITEVCLKREAKDPLGRRQSGWQSVHSKWKISVWLSHSSFCIYSHKWWYNLNKNLPAAGLSAGWNTWKRKSSAPPCPPPAIFQDWKTFISKSGFSNRVDLQRLSGMNHKVLFVLELFSEISAGTPGSCGTF